MRNRPSRAKGGGGREARDTMGNAPPPPLDSFVHDPHAPVFTGSGDFGGCQWPVKTGSFTDTRNKTCYCKWMHWCLPIYRY
jgi:hypothetical protein